jgi:pimeloyl-ACP methyl ester carboxylesterase
MNLRSLVPVGCGAVLFAALPIGLLAGPKLDFDRITPVPSTEPIPIFDFFREPFLQKPELNPSGTHIAAVVSAGEDHTSLMVMNLASKQIEAVSVRGDSDIGNVWWLDDEHYLYEISVKKLGRATFCAGRVGHSGDSYPVMQYTGASLIAVPPADRLHPLVRLPNYTDVTGNYPEAMQVNAAFGTGKLMEPLKPGMTNMKQFDEVAEDNRRHISRRYPVLETPRGFNLSYFANKDGELAFAVSSTDGILTLHRLNGDEWVPCPEDLDEIVVLGAADETGEIAAIGPRREGKPRALEILNAADGVSKEVLIDDKVYDFNGWLYRDPVSHRIVGAVFDRAGPEVFWFDQGYRDLQKAVNKLFPGQVARIIGNDEKGKGVLISAYSDRQPAVYNYVDLEKHTVSPVQNSRPWIDPARMQPTSIIKYKTRDGRRIDAYVTLPAGATKANPPPVVVLLPEHNGSRIRWEFDPVTQFFASRGYAVYRPNHRGSAGYAGQFPTADEWDFRKMREDVIDATKTLLGSGYVNPQQVAIMGSGFGGHLALAAAAFEPAMFQCAVAGSPVADWANWVEETRMEKFENAYFTRMVRKLGDPKKQPEKFDAISPLRHAGDMRAAVFIYTGEYDSSDGIARNKELLAKVRHNGHPAEFESFRNEGMGVRHIGNAVELYSRIDAFLAANLKNRAPAP